MITPRSKDFPAWYLDVIREADLAEHSPVKGCMVIKPTGYALWEKVQNTLDRLFKEADVENAYFPLFIPKSFITKEEEHVEGFAPELVTITKVGDKKLDEELIVRPTSETIIHTSFAKWINSYRDLPLILNQWANVVRWEKRTRLFLRTTEFLWQEGHTAHATEEDAEKRTLQMLEVYRNLVEDYMAIPVTLGQKSESERFAGALRTYTLEPMMQDGKALQIATSHNLGQGFAKAFDITYTDQKNNDQYCWLTSWGLSTRSIGGLIMTHADDKGMIVPPKIAPTQVMIIPIVPKKEFEKDVYTKTDEILETLKKKGILVKVDKSDTKFGEKSFKWEKKGVPVRIEIGPKDIEKGNVILVRRDTGNKKPVAISDLIKEVNTLMDDIQKNLFNRANEYRQKKTKKVDTWDDFKKEIKNNNFVLAHWNGNAETEDKIGKETKATIRCIPFDEHEENGKCVYSGKPSKKRALFAKAY